MHFVHLKLHWIETYLAPWRVFQLFASNTHQSRCPIHKPNPILSILLMVKEIDNGHKTICQNSFNWTYHGLSKYVGFAKSVISIQHLANLSRHDMIFTTAIMDVSFIKMSLLDLMFFFSSESETLNSS